MSGSGYGPGIVRGILQRWSRVKSYGLGESDDTHGGGTKLAKVLSTLDLTLLGIGSTLGVGIYVLAGSVALDTAGPAVCISFLVAAVASAFAAMCYAEFGARVPKAGSAYIYSYVTVGEFIAFVIGWNLILEYLIGTASVARALSSNVDALTNGTMSAAFQSVFPIDADGLSSYADFFSFIMVIVLAVLLGAGMRSSAIFTNIFTFVNVAVVIFVIIAGSINADPKNWSIPPEEVPPGFGTGGFAPYGVGGIMAGAAKCFFAFVGFDSIAATGEEAKNAKRSIPISINLTLLVVFLAYFGVSTVITLMWPYYLQDPETPLIYVFQQLGWIASSWTISIGSLFGLAASLLGAMLPLPRVIYAQAKDGLVFRFLAYLSPRFQTPVIATVVSALAAGVLAMIFDLDSLVDMMSIGTLLAYTLVAVSVLILRYEHIDLNDESIEKELRESPRYSWDQHPTKSTARTATLITALYCALAIILCGLGVGLGEQMNQWVLFGLGLILGIMVAGLVYLAVLPRSLRKLYFRVPLVPLVPAISIVINVYLMMKLSSATWIRFAVWMAVGFVIYFGYGMWNSSEEYVKKGKPVPGSGEARQGADNEAFTGVETELSLTVQVEKQQTQNNENLALEILHNELQEIFDQIANEKRELEKATESQKAQFAEYTANLHVKAQNVFEAIRDSKKAEEASQQQAMALAFEGAKKLDRKIQEIFDNEAGKRDVANNEESQELNAGEMYRIVTECREKAEAVYDSIKDLVEEEELSNRAEIAKNLLIISQLHEKLREIFGRNQKKENVKKGPMSAVFDELKTKVILAPEEAELDSEILEAARNKNENSIPSTPKGPIVSPAAAGMLEELKETFKQRMNSED